MSDLVVTNIIIAKDNSFMDSMGHYTASFELSGNDILDYYKVRLSTDNGSTFDDITDDVSIVDEVATYALSADTAHQLLIIPFAVSVNTYPVDLPSYTSIPDYATSVQNRFDIFDGTNKIVVYKPLQNRWGYNYKWQSDCAEKIGNKLYDWKNGALWLHNEATDSFNVIHGEEMPQRICFPINIEDGYSVVKNVKNIAIEGDGNKPTYTVLYSEKPLLQITDLTADDWDNGEGILTAHFFQDRLSGLDGSMITNLMEGEPVISQTPMCMIEFNVYDEPLILLFLNIGVSVSSGNNQILK